MPRSTIHQTHLALALALAAPALAQPATDFDTQTEGFKGTSFVIDGITVSGVNNVFGLNPDGSNFAPGEYGDQVVIEQADYLFNDFPGVVSPVNVLGFGGSFIGGPNLSINIVSTVSMDPQQTATGVEFDLLYFENGPWGAIEIHLDALDAAGALVARETVVISNLGGRDNLGVHHFNLSAPAFETVRLHANFDDGVNTVFSGVADNLTFHAAPTCPADMNGDGILDNGDIGAFVQLFLANDIAADFNGDGFLDNGDIGAFVASFLAGC
ncbi:MAG: hypothetical protein ACI89L_001730 [Phycisphaerales bacterium]|jgi:hypothetical protein